MKFTHRKEDIFQINFRQFSKNIWEFLSETTILSTAKNVGQVFRVN